MSSESNPDRGEEKTLFDVDFLLKYFRGRGFWVNFFKKCGECGEFF